MILLSSINFKLEVIQNVLMANFDFLAPLSDDRELSWYLNPHNIRNQTLPQDTIAFFEKGPRAGYMPPLVFLNFLHKQVDYVHAHMNEGPSIVHYFEQLPIEKDLLHILLAHLLKWYGGYPVNYMLPEQQATMKAIEKLLLSYPGDTPEKVFAKGDKDFADYMHQLGIAFTTSLQYGIDVQDVLAAMPTTKKPKENFDSFEALFEAAILYQAIGPFKNSSHKATTKASIHFGFNQWLTAYKGWEYADKQGYQDLLTKNNLLEYLRYHDESREQETDQHLREVESWNYRKAPALTAAAGQNNSYVEKKTVLPQIDLNLCDLEKDNQFFAEKVADFLRRQSIAEKFVATQEFIDLETKAFLATYGQTPLVITVKNNGKDVPLFNHSKYAVVAYEYLALGHNYSVRSLIELARQDCKIINEQIEKIHGSMSGSVPVNGDFDEIILNWLLTGVGFLLYKRFLERMRQDSNNNKNSIIPVMMAAEKAPGEKLQLKKTKVFVTYRWESEDHKQEVLSFTNFLRSKGFDATLDLKEAETETSINFHTMMHFNIQNNNKVIVILSPDYKRRAEAKQGGVGVEYQLILSTIDTYPRKYILASFQEVSPDIVPFGLSQREVLNLKNKDNHERLFAKLMDVSMVELAPVADTLPVIKKITAKPFEAKSLQKKGITATKNDTQDDEPSHKWDVIEAKAVFGSAKTNNNVLMLKDLIKSQPYILRDIASRKDFQQPVFKEVRFGNHQVDFLWLNDNSGGPEWVLVKLGPSQLPWLDKERKPAAELTEHLDMIREWRHYFEKYPEQKRAVFGAVATFRMVLVIGTGKDWDKEDPAIWRLQTEKEHAVEIRSWDGLEAEINEYETSPDNFWGQEEHEVCKSQEQIEPYFKTYDYFKKWRAWL